MLRKLVQGIIDVIAWIKKRRKINQEKLKKICGSCIRVNIGCGLAVVPGWINIDSGINTFFAKWPKFFHKFLYSFSNSKRWYSLQDYCNIFKDNIFIHHNLKFGLPFTDESIDYIYSSHFIEHLFRDEAVQVFKEIYRTLKGGGIVRICVPDLEVAVRHYQAGEKEKMLGYFFATNRTDYFGHQYMYDFDLLKQLILDIGFVNIRKCAYKEGKIPDVDKLDTRPGDSLQVEAEKPAKEL